MISVSGRFLRRNGNLPPVFLPVKSHEQGSLAGYSLWSHKKLDTTQGLKITTNSA